MEQQLLKKDLLENKLLLKGLFGNATDFYTKDIELFGIPCCICMFEGLSSIERLWIMMLDILSRPERAISDPEELFDYIWRKTAVPMESKCVLCVDDARAQLTAGTSVILIDGVDRALVISTQSMQFRSVQEPSGENNIRGSREGFTELLRVNISLIRRLIRTDELMVETMSLGERTQTEIALLYNRKLVSQKLLRLVRERLENTQLPFVFDSGYLAAFLQRSRFSFFQAVGYTERPDTSSAKICEGKIIVLANGSPFAMIVPYFFNENFQSMDDYSEKAYFASLIRIVKYVAFFLAVMLPGVFVSIANFTPELLPPQLLYKVAAAEMATPLPLFLEALFVNFLLEIVREAGLRLPKPIGHSVSLVAALIVGDAAVSAGILGTPVVIVIALTAICTYVVPSLYEPVTVLRILFILAGGILGPLGISALTVWMLSNLCSMNPFGIPYLAPIAPARKDFLRDGMIRSSWKRLAKSDFYVDKLQEAEESE
ncbi:spore germination protein [Ruthenibacterium sp. CLA-JM-H11]|uniref:Spore germination protein n=1 Tax=Ruthenibacterium intestinale TaxID=3133163 RepID=A0ABV1GFX4_9FIRM